MRLIYWSIDTKDYEKTITDSVSHVKSQLSKMFRKNSHYYKSAILLSHDYKFDEGMMDNLIDEFENRGLKMCTPADCLGPVLYYVNEDD
jgi:hypothetical protein